MFRSFIIIFMVTSPVLSFTIGNRTTICGTLTNETAICGLNSTENICILPPYPNNGTYSMEGNSKPVPGDAYDRAFLNITCNPGFSLSSKRSFAYCVKGLGWLDPMPKCIIPSCSLPNQKSVEYRCTTDEETRECNINVPNGTVVQPVCRKPNYKFPGDLPYMHCVDGVWDYVAICIPNRKRTTTRINSFLHISITTGNNENVRVNTRPGRVDISLKLNIFNTNNTNNKDNQINNHNSTGLPVGNTNVTTDKATDDHNSDLDESFWRLSDVELR